MSNLNWEKAKHDLDEVRLFYMDLKGAKPNKFLRERLDPLDRRFDLGERTQELYDAIMEVKL
jgi:hypothetical protein